MVFGYWREWELVADSRWAGVETPWSYRYVPYVVTVVFVIGTLSGLLPYGINWQLDLLVIATGLMAGLCWLLVPLRGRLFAVAVAVLIGLGSAANLFAVLAVSGWQDNAQVALVTMGCLAMWLVQYRIADGVLRLRIRFGCHLIYYYLLVWLGMLVGVVGGLFTFDLLNQSILQAQPLTQFLAGFIGSPELGTESVEALSESQRRDLQWIYIAFIMIISPTTYLLSKAIPPYYNIWIMQHINQALRLALVERWHQLSLRYHGDHRVGDSVYRIYQDSAQVTAIVGMIVKVSTQVSQYTMVVVLVAALDPLLGLMGVTIALLAVAWARWFSPRIRTRSLVARETNSDLTSRIQETLSGVRLVKAFGTERQEQARFENDSRVAFNAAFRVRHLAAVVGIIMFSLAAVVLLSAEFFMAIWAGSGRETVAAVLIGLVGLSFVRWNLGAFQWAQNELFTSSDQVRGVVREWTTAQDMAMGLDRVFEILDIEPEVTDAPDARPMPAFQREICFDNVSFSYEPGREVLRDVSFTAAPGTITAIVGPTGSGKSTLVSLLLRLFDPDRGRISVDGNDLRDLQLESLRENVSIALQENVLFAMTLRDNIRYVVPDASDDEVRRAAHVACVDDFLDALPEGLETELGDRGGRLSTGQRQRLSIARALVKNTPILILDEPTAALDAATEHEVLNRLGRWGEGRAIFLITHRLSTIRQADQILFLDQGRILEQGSHSEMMEISGGQYRNFVETERSLHAPGTTT
jgi:ABC-type multidrug transport system fused ATPase/permease subunit